MFLSSRRCLYSSETSEMHVSPLTSRSNTSSENYKYEIESTENLNDYMNQFNELLNTKKKL